MTTLQQKNDNIKSLNKSAPDLIKLNYFEDNPSGYSSHETDISYIEKNIPCQWACPALTDIPGYINAIYEGDYNKSYNINRTANLFPGVLGRICARPCQDKCRHGESELGEPVSICFLKRFASDNRSKDYMFTEPMFTPSDKSVAIVGGGPAGLSVAHSLALFGHKVTIYEAMDQLGGMLIYGIPRFRLPLDIIKEEIFNIIRLGVQVNYNCRLGDNINISDLLNTYNAVVLTAGCYIAKNLNIEGENLNQVYSGLNFMKLVNENTPPPIGKNVMVIGGGFTAMDCARSALRLGAKQVTICVRKTEEDLPVTKEEILETKKEGVKFLSLVSPVAINGDKTVNSIIFSRNHIKFSSEISKNVVSPIKGSDYSLSTDTVIVAIGQNADKNYILNGLNEKVTFDIKNGKSNINTLFSAGDFIKGTTTVINAIGHAKKIAANVDAFLVGRLRQKRMLNITHVNTTERKRHWDFIKPQNMPALDLSKRLESSLFEVESGFNKELGSTESKRCYLCNLKYEIHIPDCIYCRWCIDLCPRNCIGLASEIHWDKNKKMKIKWTKNWNEVKGIVIDSERCIRCGECVNICPVKCIHVRKIEISDKLLPESENGEE